MKKLIFIDRRASKEQLREAIIICNTVKLLDAYKKRAAHMKIVLAEVEPIGGRHAFSWLRRCFTVQHV